MTSPSLPLTPDQFADAFAKGLGRAVRHLRLTHDAGPNREQVRLAYQKDPRFEFMTENSRAWYIVECAAAIGDSETLRATIAQSASTALSPGDCAHAIALAAEIARRGDIPARQLLEPLFAQSVGHKWFIGGFELIELLGLDGLCAIARNLGENLPKESRWRYRAWSEAAAEVFSPKQVRARVWREGRTDSNARAFLRRMVRMSGVRATSRKRRRVRGQSPAGLSLDDFLAFVRTNESMAPRRAGMRWWRRASRAELERAARLFCTTEDIKVARALVGALYHGSYFGDIDALVARTRESRPEFAECAKQVAAGCSDPRIRRGALEFIEQGDIGSKTIRMLASSAESEDLLVIERALATLELPDAEFAHGIVLDLLQVCREFDPPETTHLLEWIYRCSPCGFCRFGAFTDLVEAGAAPDWMIEEALLDSHDETRRAAAQARRSTDHGSP